MELVPVERIPDIRAHRKGKVMDILDKFIESGESAAEIINTGEYKSMYAMYSSVRSTIKRYKKYKDYVYSCSRVGKLFLVKIKINHEEKSCGM